MIIKMLIKAKSYSNSIHIKPKFVNENTDLIYTFPLSKHQEKIQIQQH